MKLFKRWRYILFIIVAVGIVFGVWFFARQTISDTYPKAWADWRDKLQTAVAGYQNASDSALPTIGDNATVAISGKSCLIIDICKLKSANLIPPPDSCAKIDGANNDNCDGGNCSCYNSAHYVWALDSNGSVCSVCTGDKCRASDADGYQGVWP